MSDIDPALLAALTGLLDQRGDDEPAPEVEETAQAVPEVSSSIYEKLAEYERMVN